MNEEEKKEKGNIEEAVEKTGEVIGKGVKKGVKSTQEFWQRHSKKY